MAIPLLEIGKLQQPEPVKFAQVDFTPLQKIGDQIGQARIKGQVEEVVSRSRRSDGTLDLARAGSDLAGAGLLEYGKPLLELEFRRQSLAMAGGAQAEAARHNRAVEAQAAATLQATLDKPTDHVVPDGWGGEPTIIQSKRNGEFRKVYGPGMGGVDPASAGSPVAAPAAAPQAAAVAPPAVDPNAQANFADRFSGATPDAAGAVQPAAAQPAAAANVPVMSQPGNEFGTPNANNPKGEAFLLANVPPKAAELVRRVANYDLDPRTLREGKLKDNVIRAAAIYDPTYKMDEFPARQAAFKDFSTKHADTIRSFDVSIDHLGTLEKAGKALENGDYPLLNKLGNFIATQTGKPAPTDFNAVKAIVGDELVKAILGSGGSALGDREEMKGNINAANSPQQLAGVIQKYKDLMAGQVAGLRKQYMDTTKRPGESFDARLSEHTKEALKLRVNPKEGGYEVSQETIAKAQANPDATYAEAKSLADRGADKAQIRALLLKAGLDPKKIGL